MGSEGGGLDAAGEWTDPQRLRVAELNEGEPLRLAIPSSATPHHRHTTTDQGRGGEHEDAGRAKEVRKEQKAASSSLAVGMVVCCRCCVCCVYGVCLLTVCLSACGCP